MCQKCQYSDHPMIFLTLQVLQSKFLSNLFLFYFRCVLISGSRIVDPRKVDPRMVDPRMVDPNESWSNFLIPRKVDPKESWSLYLIPCGASKFHYSTIVKYWHWNLKVLGWNASWLKSASSGPNISGPWDFRGVLRPHPAWLRPRRPQQDSGIFRQKSAVKPQHGRMVWWRYFWQSALPILPTLHPSLPHRLWISSIHILPPTKQDL